MDTSSSRPEFNIIIVGLGERVHHGKIKVIFDIATQCDSEKISALFGPYKLSDTMPHNIDTGLNNICTIMVRGGLIC